MKQYKILVMFVSADLDEKAKALSTQVIEFPEKDMAELAIFELRKFEDPTLYTTKIIRLY